MKDMNRETRFADIMDNVNSVVQVHDGQMHADDVICVALLNLARSAGKIQVVRTRDVVPAMPTIMVDIGEGLYDHHGSRYEMWEKYNVPHCGATRLLDDADVREALCQKFGLDKVGWGYFVKKFIVPIARVDNGQSLQPGEENYFSWVGLFNHPALTPDDRKSDDERFSAAVDMAAKIIVRGLKEALSHQNASAFWDEVLPTTADVLTIPAGIPGWRERLVDTPVKFVITEGEASTPWYLTAVPPSMEEWQSQKCPLPEAWAGKRDEELDAISGIQGCVFCHAGRFIAGFKDKNAAMLAAIYALRAEGQHERG